jgi:hypothetical protein
MEGSQWNVRQGGSTRTCGSKTTSERKKEAIRGITGMETKRKRG